MPRAGDAARAARRYGRTTMATPAAALPATPRAHRDHAIDAGLAAAALAITVVTLAQESGPLGADGIALSLLASLPLLGWRRAPLTAFVVTSAASVAINALGYDLGLGGAPTIMVFVLARMAPAARPSATGLAIVVSFFAQVGADYADGTWSPLSIPPLGWLLVGGGGRGVREQAEEEAAGRAAVQRERQLRVGEERPRIARDLHDSA